MITDPSANVELTFEQLQQIETSKGILRNLEAETAIANKNLSVLHKEVVKATKEREYQEELIAGLVVQREEKDAELESVSSSLSLAKEELEMTIKDTETLDKEAKETRADLHKREEAVLKAEKDISEARTALHKDRETLEKERKAVDTAKTAFKEAALTVTWS